MKRFRACQGIMDFTNSASCRQKRRVLALILVDFIGMLDGITNVQI